MRVFVHFQAQKPDEEINVPVEKTIDISLVCRLVKDYRETIQLKARVWPSSLQISTFNLTFRGRLEVASSQEAIQIDLFDQEKELLFHNMANSTTRYRVMNDSLFFTVDIDEGDIKVGSTAKVVVRLKFEAIQQNRRLFLKEKYIEEHLTVYSLHPRRYTERCFVAIRLMLGHLPSDLFYTSPGAKNAYPFVTLEERIVCFMRDSNVFFTYPVRPQAEDSDSNADGGHPLWTALRNIVNQTTDEERQQWMDSVSFELQYITDQLSFYGLKKQTGGNALRLAHLLFSGLQKQHDLNAFLHKWAKSKHVAGPDRAVAREGARVLLFMISQWAERLSFFVGLFPEVGEDLDLLRALCLQLRNQTIQLHGFIDGANAAEGATGKNTKEEKEADSL